MKIPTLGGGFSLQKGADMLLGHSLELLSNIYDTSLDTSSADKAKQNNENATSEYWCNIN
jgi:hypothetical protein